MEQAAQALLERILSRENAPSLSPLTVRLVALAADDQADMQDLARIIEQDPGLTTRLLRLVNSPAFRVSEEEIGSVRRAVVFLGLREVRIMALGISLRHTLPLQKDDPRYYYYWRASLHRAVMARLCAAKLGLPTAEELFVAGLLADLGLPLLLDALEPAALDGFPGMRAGLAAQLAWERQNLGLDHRQIGAAVMRRWGLPDILVRCQNPVFDEQGQQSTERKVVDFACRGVEALFGEVCGIPALHELAKTRLGLDAEAVNKLIGETLRLAAEAAQVMDVELDQRADLLEVMEKANQALGRLSRQMEPHVRRIVIGGGTDARRLQEETLVNTLEAVAHEIRNPLMSVGGFARRLAKLLEGGGELQHYAQVILDEAGRLDGVLAEMSSLAAPFSPQVEPLSLNELVEMVCGRMPASGPTLTMHLPRPPLDVMADRRGLEKTLELMLAYGAHLARRGGDGKVHVHLACLDGEVALTVFGAGEQPACEAPLADRSFGPELGLAKARRIVEAHGGRLSVEPGPKGGGFVLGAHLPQVWQDQPGQRLSA